MAKSSRCESFGGSSLESSVCSGDDREQIRRCYSYFFDSYGLEGGEPGTTGATMLICPEGIKRLAGKCSVSASKGDIVRIDIGRVTPAQIEEFIESQLSGIHPDCIFLSCTNWRAIDAIVSLEGKLKIPIISSNHAAIDFVQQHAKATLTNGGQL